MKKNSRSVDGVHRNLFLFSNLLIYFHVVFNCIGDKGLSFDDLNTIRGKSNVLLAYVFIILKGRNILRKLHQNHYICILLLLFLIPDM